MTKLNKCDLKAIIKSIEHWEQISKLLADATFVKRVSTSTHDNDPNIICYNESNEEVGRFNYYSSGCPCCIRAKYDTKVGNSCSDCPAYKVTGDKCFDSGWSSFSEGLYCVGYLIPVPIEDEVRTYANLVLEWLLRAKMLANDHVRDCRRSVKAKKL